MSARPQAAIADALGRYRLGPVIGRGATATVHRALDLETHTEVAVKIVPAREEIVPRLRAEIRAVVRMDHPSIVALLDWGSDDEAVYLVSELVEGVSLAEELEEGPVDERDAVRVVRDVLAGLAHAHERGVVHRDVKPANIMVDADGRGRLTDFGVARLAGESGLTETGGVVGTMAYMAPEQARGSRVGPRADVYAATLMLFEALTGQSPLLADNPAETARRAAEGDIPSLAELRPDLPRALVAAVSAGLARSPRERPEAAEMAALLGEIQPKLGAARHARRLAPVATGIAAGAATGAGLAAATELPTAALVGAAALAAAVALARPRWAAAAGAALAVGLLASRAPGLGLVAGAGALVLLATGWRAGRAIVMPAIAPLLAALGLGPLYAAFAGALPRWPARLWAAAAGAATMLAWQTGAGTASLMFGGRRVDPQVAATEGEISPLVAGEAVGQTLLDQPGALAQAGVLIVAALAFPLVMRARPGGARAAAAAAWSLAIVALAVAYADDPAVAVAATLPTLVIALVWGLRPWAHLAGHGGSTASATLPNPSDDRA